MFARKNSKVALTFLCLVVALGLATVSEANSLVHSPRDHAQINRMIKKRNPAGDDLFSIFGGGAAPIGAEGTPTAVASTDSATSTSASATGTSTSLTGTGLGLLPTSDSVSAIVSQGHQQCADMKYRRRRPPAR